MKHCLVATLGTTPQVLTEAFYYYRRHLGIEITEIEVFTTTRGAEALEQTVLATGKAFDRLCRHLKIRRSSVRFDPSSVHVLTGAGGRAIDDVRSSEDAAKVADDMLAELRVICRDSDRTVYALIAGGRKVMGLFLHATMQLVGRPHDKLFHVLVHDALERRMFRGEFSEFFYPDKALVVDGATLQPDELLTHIEIPFIWSARTQNRDQGLSYGELVARRQSELTTAFERPPVTIDCRNRSVRVGSVGIALNLELFLWYLVMARRALYGLGLFPVSDLMLGLRFSEPRLPRIDPARRDAAALTVVLTDLVRSCRLADVSGEEAGLLVHKWLRPRKVNRPRFDQVVTRIKDALVDAVGDAADPYRLNSVRRRGCQINLPPDKIHIIGLDGKRLA